MKGVIRSEREGSAGVVRGTLSVILNECEGSITVVRKPAKRGIAISCELQANYSFTI